MTQRLTSQGYTVLAYVRHRAKLLEAMAQTGAGDNCGSWPPRAASFDFVAAHYGVSSRTVRRWVEAYKQHDSAFLPDGRGRHERGWLLHEEDLRARFAAEFGRQLDAEECSVLSMQRFVNDLSTNGLFGDEGVRTDPAGKLAKYGLKHPISEMTVYNWMRRCGGRYTGFKSGFYTDKHEHPDVIQYRHEYICIHKMLMARRPMYLHIPDAEVDIINVNLRKRPEKKKTKAGSSANDPCPAKKLPKPLLRFQDDAGRWFNEFHVDANEMLDVRREELPLGGVCSVTYDEEALREKPCEFGHAADVCLCHKVLLVVGQDESIFKPQVYSKMVWEMEGKKSIRPKGEGQGVMVSGFQGDHDGMALTLSAEQLAAVNERRAKATPPREPLTESPAVRLFEYGCNRAGYWDAECMNRQVEDYMDCFEEKYPGLQMCLELDHSGCHSKMADDACISTHMAMAVGGKQRVPRTVVLQDAAQIGPHDPKVVLGDTYSFRFVQGDPPPFQQPDAKEEEYIGLPKGKPAARIHAYKLLYQHGMPVCIFALSRTHAQMCALTHRTPALRRHCPGTI